MTAYDLDRLAGEVAALTRENAELRRRLAQLTAQYVWAEGGSFPKIQQEIAEFGFKLMKGTEGYTPRIVPLAD